MTKDKKKRLVAGLFGVLAVSIAGIAFGGARYPYYGVIVNLDDPGNKWAAGTLGETRNTIDENEYIGCSVYAYEDSNSYGHTYAYCYAFDRFGNYLSCLFGEGFSGSEKLLDNIRSIKGDSSVYFSIGFSNACKEIDVHNGSMYAPKALP